MIGPLSNPRELREFTEAKRRKREPIRLTAEASASATAEPRDPAAFEGLLARLRGVTDWGRSMESFDRISTALFRRHTVRVPKPRKVIQGADGSLTFFWGKDLTVACFPDGAAFSFLGQRHRLVHGQESERVLLDALRAQTK